MDLQESRNHIINNSMITFAEEILSTIKLSCLYEIEIASNKIKSHALIHSGLSKSFNTYEEPSELYDFLYEISKDFNMSEDSAYYLFMISKHDTDGSISKNFKETFATHLTLYDNGYYNDWTN